MPIINLVSNLSCYCTGVTLLGKLNNAGNSALYETGFANGPKGVREEAIPAAVSVSLHTPSRSESNDPISHNDSSSLLWLRKSCPKGFKLFPPPGLMRQVIQRAFPAQTSLAAFLLSETSTGTQDLQSLGASRLASK